MGEYTRNLRLEKPYANVFNSNADKIDTAITKRGHREYLIAAPDSDSRYRNLADVCIDSDTEAFTKMKEIINMMSDGDTLRISPGFYGLYPDTEEGIVINKKIRILGCGISNTYLMIRGLNGNMTKGAAFFTIRSEFVEIADVLMADLSTMNNEYALINLAADSTKLSGIFFLQNVKTAVNAWFIRSLDECHYIRIEGCRFYRRTSSPQRPMLNFGDYGFYDSVIGSIVMSGYDVFSIKYKDDDSKNRNVLYGIRNYTQYLILAYNEKESEKEHIYN